MLQNYSQEERFRLLVEGVTDYAMLLLDPDGRIVGWNPGAEKIFGYEESEILGQPGSLLFTPEDRAAGAPEQELEKAGTQGRAADIRWHQKKDGSRFWADGVMMSLRTETGDLRGFGKVLRDATETKQTEDTLRESEARFHQMADAIPHIAWTTGPDGSVDYYNQRWHDYSGLTLDETRDWGWERVIHPDDLARAGGVWRAAVEAGVVSEVEYRLRRADGEYRWHLGRSEPVRDTAGQVIIWIGTATDIETHKRAEEERERLLAEARARAERETLINRINAAVRSTTNVDLIQETVATLLGEALGADRCYFSVYDSQRDAVRIAQDWRRPDLPSVAGEFRLSEYQEYVDALYAQGNAVIPDALAPTLAPVVRRTLARFGIRAFLAVPLLDGGRFVAAVSASMNDRPRAWTAQEILLMEAVLTQTRTAAEAARLQQRERNIAQQLQEALQPPLPGVVPGIALARHYDAALDEAGVGGDFYDVFPIEKGCTILVVGDLSGKGLAAAAQVSTVRNMLRAFLYSKPTLAEAVTELNRVVTQNNLLTGFATLFVGCYDGGARTLAFVNCGQEPGLMRRAASGEIIELPPTGPILGMAEAAVFEEQSITLMPGDALALFTDGLTEAGPNRRELLGLNGVAALLAEGNSDSGQTAETLAQRLIAGVDAYARGGVRDDVCLLVAVVNGG